jgi:hypothetical protein
MAEGIYESSAVISADASQKQGSSQMGPPWDVYHHSITEWDELFEVVAISPNLYREQEAQSSLSRRAIRGHF